MSDKIQVVFSYKSGYDVFYGCRNPNKPDDIKLVKTDELVKGLKTAPKGKFDVEITDNETIAHLGGSPVEQLDFGEFALGDELAAVCAEFMAMECRDAYFQVRDFVSRADTVRIVAILYGMRSTGKTVILKQLAGRAEFLKESAYLTLNYAEYSIDDVYAWMKNLRKIGIKYFYIDEVTWADGFADRAMAFADKFASVSLVRIVLSGTDSLAFAFAKQSSLHGRYLEFSTTRMSYPEYYRITKGDILKYAHSGGVFWRKPDYPPDEDEVEEYLISSVVRNLRNTILNSSRKVMVGEEIRFLDERELYAICHAICECLSLSNMYEHANAAWGEPLAKVVEAAMRDCGISIPAAAKAKIRSYAPVFKSVSSKYDRKKANAVLEMMKMIGFIWLVDLRSDTEPRVKPVFAQTAVSRAFALFAMQTVLKSAALSGEIKESEVLEGIEEAADGYMLELACLITFAKRIESRGDSLLYLSAFRIFSGDGEIDIVVHDRRESALYLYEVKRSDEAKSDHGKNLINTKLIEYMREQYDAITVHRAVLYRGDDDFTKLRGEIPYYKIEDYLIRVENGEIF
ncbi:MAG: AAA family ATPase [Oscillospiraceae bacterium]|nr:AAA family ATPase [Oscillospiraceae bacterium]